MQDSFSELKQPSASGPGHFSWLFLKQEPNSVQLRGVFLHGLESNPGSSLQTEEDAALP